MQEDLVPVIGQLLLNCRHQSGEFKGWPILCSDPDFNDLPLTPDSLGEGDDYSEEDIRILAKSILTWVLDQISDPHFDAVKFEAGIRESLRKE